MRNNFLTILIITLALIFFAASTVAAISTLAAIPNIQLGPTAFPNAPSFAAEVETRVRQADPSVGAALFNKYGCVNCHGTPNGAGPYVVGLGQRAATRRAPQYSAAAYLYESITDPNAYVVESYPPSVMPQNFKSVLPENDLYNLIAWLLTQ